MTETPIEPPAEQDEQEPDATVAEAGPVAASCRHCGAPVEFGPEGEPDDWQCDKCGRFQDTMVCPTCHTIVRISLMPEDLAPEAHAPQRRRRREA